MSRGPGFNMHHGHDTLHCSTLNLVVSKHFAVSSVFSLVPGLNKINMLNLEGVCCLCGHGHPGRSTSTGRSFCFWVYLWGSVKPRVHTILFLAALALEGATVRGEVLALRGALALGEALVLGWVLILGGALALACASVQGCSFAQSHSAIG